MKCLSLLLAMALLLPLVAGCSKSEQKPAEESAAPFRAWIGSETVELDPALAFTPMQQSAQMVSPTAAQMPAAETAEDIFGVAQ